MVDAFLVPPGEATFFAVPRFVAARRKVAVFLEVALVRVAPLREAVRLVLTFRAMDVFWLRNSE